MNVACVDGTHRWVRLNFNYFISEAEFQYIVDAVELVAKYGWRMLPFYNCCPHTGRWQHCSTLIPELASQFSPEILSLNDISFDGGRPSFPARSALPAGPQDENLYEEYLIQGRKIFDEAASRLRYFKSIAHCRPSLMCLEVKKLRWFALKEDVMDHPFWKSCARDGGSADGPSDLAEEVSTWTLSGVLDDIEEAVQAEEALSCPPPCSVAQVWKGCASGRCSARFTPHLGAVLVFFAIVAFVIGALLTHL